MVYLFNYSPILSSLKIRVEAFEECKVLKSVSLKLVEFDIFTRFLLVQVLFTLNGLLFDLNRVEFDWYQFSDTFGDIFSKLLLNFFSVDISQTFWRPVKLGCGLCGLIGRCIKDIVKVRIFFIIFELLLHFRIFELFGNLL